MRPTITISITLADQCVHTALALRRSRPLVDEPPSCTNFRPRNGSFAVTAMSSRHRGAGSGRYAPARRHPGDVEMVQGTAGADGDAVAIAGTVQIAGAGPESTWPCGRTCLNAGPPGQCARRPGPDTAAALDRGQRRPVGGGVPGRRGSGAGRSGRGADGARAVVAEGVRPQPLAFSIVHSSGC